MVADEHIAMASSALKEANFVPCRKGSSCPGSLGFQARPPTEHLHISEKIVISLYKKSDVLWKFGVFGFCQFEQSPHILSASDVRPMTLYVAFFLCHVGLSYFSCRRFYEALRVRLTGNWTHYATQRRHVMISEYLVSA